MVTNIFKADSCILFRFEEKSCRALKWKIGPGRHRRVLRSVSFQYSSFEDTSMLAKVNDAFKDLDYANERVFFVISHQLVSSSFLRLPAEDSAEIKAMIHLQAMKDLPFTPEELVFGYQVIETDGEGFSSVNMIFSRKDKINTLVGVFRQARVDVDAVYLSTYGLVETFNYLKPEESGEVMLVNLQEAGLEAMVVKDHRMYLSRFAALQKIETSRKENVFKQIMDTNSLYLRQVPFGPIKKVFLTGSAELIGECKPILDEKMLVPVGIVAIPDNFENISLKLGVENISPELLGFIIKRPVDSLSLLPKEHAVLRERLRERRSRLNLFIIAFVTAVLLILGGLLYTGNKKAYLSYLDGQARELEARTGKLQLKITELSAFRNKKKTALELIGFFAAIHRAIPSGMMISAVRYDSQEAEALNIKGYSEKLDTVFAYASALRGESVFSSGEVKVKQATSRPVKDGEIVNFEISFMRKK